MSKLKLSARQYFIGAVQIIPTCLDDMIAAADYLSRTTKIDSFDYGQAPFIAFVEGEMSDAYIRAGLSDSERALRLLLAEDLRRLCEGLTVETVALLEREADIDRVREEVDALLSQELERLQIVRPSALIDFVDQFPAPFSDRDYMALMLDEGDRKAFGVTPGVYVKRDKYIPVFGRIMFLHEFVHVILGERSPDALCRGLEEGVCEFLGYLDWGGQSIGSANVALSFRRTRLRHEQNLIWTSYLEATRQAYVLYKRFGQEIFSEILRTGRDFLKEVETNVALGKFSSIERLMAQRFGTYKPTIDNALVTLCDQLLLGFAQHNAVSPIAFLVQRKLRAGKTLRELTVDTGLPLDCVSEAIEELKGALRFVTPSTDGSYISFSDQDHVQEGSQIRYLTSSVN